MSNDKVDELLANQAVLKQQMLTLNQKVDRCLDALYGPVGESELGLTVKVDRLEQTEKTRARGVWVIIVAVVGLIGESLWAALRW